MKGYITLKPSSPFYHIFASGVVPVRNVEPAWLELDPAGLQECYMLDTESCGGFVLSAVAKVCAGIQGGDKVKLREYLYNHGDLPIRVSETVEKGEGGEQGAGSGKKSRILKPENDLRFYQ